MLIVAAAVGEIACHDHERRVETFDQRRKSDPEEGILLPSMGAQVEVGNVEDACRHRRRRLQ